MGISFSLSSFWELLVSRWPELVTELFRHINMTTLALLISLAIGVPLGILITRNQTAAKIVIGIANVMQSIPSIALLSLAVCFLGIGTVPAILMVFVYAFLPILKNTYTGIMSVDPKNLEVARGMGLTRTRCLFLVELPIAAPFIMAGIRIAAVASVGTMTIAAFAGAKGLGWFINLGLNSLNVEMILLGAVPVSLLALLFDFIFAKLEQAVTSEGLLPNEQIQNLPKRVIRRRQVIAVGVCVALVVVAIGGGLSNKKSEKHITVGSANFTEVYIVGNIYKELIEAKTDIEVDTTFNLASTSLEMTAMENGDIDMVVDYSGQVYLSVLGLPLNTDPDEVYDILVDKMKNDYNIAVSAPGLQQHLRHERPAGDRRAVSARNPHRSDGRSTRTPPGLYRRLHPAGGRPSPSGVHLQHRVRRGQRPGRGRALHRHRQRPGGRHRRLRHRRPSLQV